jgi:hypothetical protein
MRYLLLIVLLCGCNYVKEDSMVIDSVTSYKEEYLYTVKSRGSLNGKPYYFTFVSNKKFHVNDKVQFSLKENENVK